MKKNEVYFNFASEYLHTQNLSQEEAYLGNENISTKRNKRNFYTMWDLRNLDTYV